MTTTRTIPTPATATTCAFWAGCASGSEAIHQVEGTNLCAFHSPYDADPDAMTRYLADFDARNADRDFTTPEEPSAAPRPSYRRRGRPSHTPTIAPSVYADWFDALLAQDLACTDYRAFEEAAYKGHIAYSLSMTDGHYAPESFEDWARGFRKDPIGQLYWGNDARHTLAPQANSYAAIIAQITFLPDTPSYDTLAPAPAPRTRGGSRNMHRGAKH